MSDKIEINQNHDFKKPTSKVAIAKEIISFADRPFFKASIAWDVSEMRIIQCGSYDQTLTRVNVNQQKNNTH